MRCVRRRPARSGRRRRAGAREAVDLVVVGPEAPLAAGVADALEAAGIRCSARRARPPGWRRRRRSATRSPARRGCRWRGPRVRRRRGGPAAAAFIRELADAGLGAVLKADGLAAGKGVIVTDVDRARRWRSRPSFLAGRPADKPALVIEERLEGREASVIAICDGTRAVALPAARDHKRLCDGDRGPEHRRHGRVLAAAGPRRRGRRGGPRDRPRADPRRDGAPRHAVPRLPLRGADAHRGRPGAARDQRPARRPGGPGDPAAPATRTSRRCSSPRPAARSPTTVPSRLPASDEAAVTIVLAADGLPGRPATRRPDRGPRRRAGRGRPRVPCRDGRAPAPEGGFGTNGGRVLAVVGRAPDLAARARPRGAGGRRRSRSTAPSAATTSPPMPRRTAVDGGAR